LKVPHDLVFARWISTWNELPSTQEQSMALREWLYTSLVRVDKTETIDRTTFFSPYSNRISAEEDIEDLVVALYSAVQEHQQTNTVVVLLAVVQCLSKFSFRGEIHETAICILLRICRRLEAYSVVSILSMRKDELFLSSDAVVYEVLETALHFESLDLGLLSDLLEEPLDSRAHENWVSFVGVGVQMQLAALKSKSRRNRIEYGIRIIERYSEILNSEIFQTASMTIEDISLSYLDSLPKPITKEVMLKIHHLFRGKGPLCDETLLDFVGQKLITDTNHTVRWQEKNTIFDDWNLHA
jgi:hypothetical protein